MSENNQEWFVVFMQNNSQGEPRIVRAKMQVSGPPEQWGRSYSIDSEAIVCSPDRLPEEFVGKISLLRMVEDAHYVEGVGVRLKENAFYVALGGEHGE